MEEIKQAQGMVYFYWDIFLILNFIMNLFLMGMTGMIRRKNIVKKRMFLASFLGSLAMTAGMILQLSLFYNDSTDLCSPNTFLVLEAIVVALVMLQITFRESSGRELLSDFWGMVQVSVITGGCLCLAGEHFSWFDNLNAWALLAGAVIVYLLFFAALYLFGKQEQQKHVLDGILSDKNGEKYTIRVLYDTGNRLVSPYTGESVMIISDKLVEKLEIKKDQLPLWIPYHSIGGDGMLPAYRLPKITLQNGEIRENFLAAVSEKISADHTIQIIWNG